MGLQGVGVVERSLRRVLFPTFVLSGAVVILGFFFPEFVGDVVSGQVWLVVSLVFFGSGLGYLAVLPSTGESTEAVPAAHYLLRVRRLSWRETAETFLSRHDPITFGVPVLAFGLFVLLRVAFPAPTTGVIERTTGFVTGTFDWLLVAVMLLSVVYCLWLLVGPWGDIRLGGDDVEPTYTYPVYFAMFFTAGIAAGIVFWGPAEALFHYDTPPPYFDAEPRSEAAIDAALAYSLFHWGVSAWSAYLVLGLPIAYYVYERGAPLRVATLLAPFIGLDRVDSLPGRLLDMLAIFATIGGIATSVALVSEQFLRGVTFQWGVDSGTVGPVLFVGGLTLVFALSAQSGVHRGIRRIAALNVVLFGLFALFVFALAPHGVLLDRSAGAVSTYAVEFVPMSLFLGNAWVEEWTIWNWAWWFSWAPFAGLFLAALSRGRTIRTVVLTAVVATSLATMVWFLLLGTTALDVQHTGEADVLASIAELGGEEAVAGFPLFGALPLAEVLIFGFLALIIVFMTTSADTSTLVVAILATRQEFAPTTATVIFWGTVQGLVAVVLVLVDGAEALQAAAVLTGALFAVVVLFALVGLSVTLYRDEREGESLLAKLPSLPFEDVYK